jgi:glycosyltransferase involved in cell wall biosynthesis
LLKKIAYIGIKGLPSKGGAERVVEAITERLKDKYKIFIYCNKRYTPNAYSSPGIELIRIPTLPGKYLQPLSLFFFSALHALLLGNFDLIHLHNAEAGFINPLLRLKYKVIATSHGPAYSREKWGKMAKVLIKLIDTPFIIFSDRVTSVSLPIANEYEEKWKRKIDYIPNGVEHNMPINKKAALNTLHHHRVDGEYILFLAGRMDRTKGCHLLLKAFSDIETDLKLVVVGDSQTDPDYYKELKSLANEKVRFIPFIADKGELFGILSGAHIFIFPSTVEAMSMALLEAASLGVPIICSDIPSNKAVLPEQALFFRSEAIDNFREKLEWALTHPAEMREMGLRAQEWVKKEFSWDLIADKYDTLFQGVMNHG